MRAFGASEAQIAAFVAEQTAQGAGTGEEALSVHPDNAAAVRLLLLTQTQWRTASLSTLSGARIVRTGIDYAALEPAARLTGRGTIEADDFARLRILESEALAAWAEQRAAER